MYRTPQNENLLVLSIRHRLEDVADRLCEMGVDVNQTDQHGDPPLWIALCSKQEAVATRLVSVCVYQWILCRQWCAVVCVFPGLLALSMCVYLISGVCACIIIYVQYCYVLSLWVQTLAIL